MTAKKYVSAEYHDGYNAYPRRQLLASNPHLAEGDAGKILQWQWGWLDAQAEDFWALKDALLNTGPQIDKRKLH